MVFCPLIASSAIRAFISALKLRRCLDFILAPFPRQRFYTLLNGPNFGKHLIAQCEDKRPEADGHSNYLRKNSSGLWNFIATQPNASEPYVVYEAYSADTLAISTEPGTDVSTKVAISSEFRALSSVDPTFSYKRESRETLLIKANNAYVFAVRTARLLIRNGVYALEFTNFAPREMKTAGGNEQFSTSVLDGYLTIKLGRVNALISAQFCWISRVL